MNDELWELIRRQIFALFTLTSKLDALSVANAHTYKVGALPSEEMVRAISKARKRPSQSSA